jgi:uncharacterized protein YndB with AHSA1/START domain
MSRLQFDFLVNKDNNTLTIRREFEAEQQLVWDCYTKQELLDQWFAPKPMTTKTKSMDFREGGFWLYVMLEPTGAEYWGRMDYQTITPIESYTALDAFCDADGNFNPELPRATWNVTFIDAGENSIVENVVTYASLNDLETVIQMGLKDGLMSTMEKLDELLLTFKK